MLLSMPVTTMSMYREALSACVGASGSWMRGGLGALCGSLIEQYPNLHVILLDRPRSHRASTQAQPQAGPNRVAVRGSLSVLGVEADAVILCRILHDWNDTDALHPFGELVRFSHLRSTPRGGDDPS